MPYLPEPEPPKTPRYVLGPLAGWLREALAPHLGAYALEKALAQMDYYYWVRRAERAPFEPVADLPREAAWLMTQLHDRREELGLTGHAWRTAQGVVRRAITAWGEDEGTPALGDGLTI